MADNSLRKTILIVEDTPANIDIIDEFLNNIYNIKIATNGVIALKILNTQPLPDLILLDIMMPEMNGYDLCKELKAREDTKDIPVVFITAKSEIEDITAGFKIGAIDYITKPFNPMELITRVKTHIDLKTYKEEVQKMTEKNSESISKLDLIRNELNNKNVRGAEELIKIISSIINK